MSTIQLPYETIIVPLGRNAKYGELQVDCGRLEPQMKQHVWEYGLRQLLNDAIAGKTEGTDILAKAQKRLERLYAGQIRGQSAAEPINPVEAEAHHLAKAALVKTA